LPYPAPGDVLADRYRIEAEIGRGGYSVVYRARDQSLETQLALKLLVPPPASEAVARERMRREAIVARGLSHPNVVALHDFTEADGRSFLTMELVDGPDLAARVAASGPMSVENVISLARDVGAALGAAHAMGVLHRDVKPQNVLLGSDGRARLADFGSARMVDMSTVTRTGGLVGTIAYAAPEIVAGDRGDARSDLYALGMTLYYALTAVLPDQRSLHLPATPSPVGFRPRAHRPDAPAWLDDLVANLTREEPSLRLPTAGALGLALSDREGGATSVPAPFRRECVLCGDADPIGAGLCMACLGTGRSDSGDDRLLFVEKVKSHSQKLEIEDWLEDVAGDESSTADIAATRRGELPLARVPAPAGPRVARHLRQIGIPVQITHPANLVGRLSVRLQVALSTSLVLGLAAGTAAPAMLILTPAFTATVLFAAVRRQSRLFLAGTHASPLDPATETRVRSTLSGLTDGAARSLLADFVRLARLPSVDGDQAECVDPHVVDELLASAEQLAQDLESLDAGLAVMERQATFASGEVETGWLETHDRVSRTRDRLVQRMLDALAALARARAAGSEAALNESADLVELARELARDAELQAEARRDVEALLG